MVTAWSLGFPCPESVLNVWKRLLLHVVVLLDNHLPDRLQLPLELGPIEIERQDSFENIDLPNVFPLYFVKEFYWKTVGFHLSISIGSISKDTWSLSHNFLSSMTVTCPKSRFHTFKTLSGHGNPGDYAGD